MIDAFEINSIGDGLFVERVLTGLAMLHESGTIAGLAAIGLLLGLFVAVTKGVMTAGRDVDFKYPLIAFCLYSVLFGVTVPVIIVDKVTAPGQTTLEVRGPIDNVPIGAAMAGYLISGIGYSIADRFEDAFSVPGSARVTEGGWGRTLETLAAAREIGAGKFMGTDGFPEFRDSNLRYISDCTMSGMQLDPTQAQKMQADPDPWKGIEYASKFLTTETRLTADGSPLSTPEMVSCSEAMIRLQNGAGTIKPSFAAYIKGRYGGEVQDSAMEDALKSIGVPASVDAQKYMEASMQAALMAEAVLKGHITSGQTSATLMIQQASEQRRTQWAAEETMLKRVLQPTIGSFEAMLYAVVPFAVFAIGLGPFGLNLATKYMILALWVQLFMPILAVVNLFQLTAMEHFVNAQMMGDGNNPLTSIHGSWAMQEKALDWLSFGATIAAATPSLALFLLFGGAVAATAMAGRLQGGDHVDEKQLSPDALKVGPVQQVAGAASFDRVGGNLTTGSEGTFTKWSFQNTAAAERQSAYSESSKASESWSTELSKVLTRGSGLSESSRESLQNSINSSLSSDTSIVGSTATTQGIAMKDLYAAASVDQSKFNAAMGGGFALPKGLFSTKIGGESSTTDSSSQQKAIDYIKSLSAEQRQSLAVSFSEGLTRTAAKAYDKALTLDESNKDSDSFRKASSDMLEKSRAFSSANKVSQSESTSQELNTAAFAQRLIQSYPGGFDALMRQGTSAVGDAAYQANAGLAELDHIHDPKQKAVAQLLLTTFGKGPGAEHLIENALPELADERRLFNAGVLAAGFSVHSSVGQPDMNRGVAHEVQDGQSRAVVDRTNLSHVRVPSHRSTQENMDNKVSLLNDPTNGSKDLLAQFVAGKPVVTDFVTKAAESNLTQSTDFAEAVVTRNYDAGGIAKTLASSPESSAYEGVPSDAYSAKMNGESFSFDSVRDQIRGNLERNYSGVFDDKTLDTMAGMGAAKHISEPSRGNADYLNGYASVQNDLKDYSEDQQRLMLGYLEGEYAKDSGEKFFFQAREQK